MLTFEKKADDGTLVTYEYRPNGTGRAGTVSIDRASGKAAVVAKSPDDDGMCTSQMLAHARRMNRMGELRPAGSISWY